MKMFETKSAASWLDAAGYEGHDARSVVLINGKAELDAFVKASTSAITIDGHTLSTRIVRRQRYNAPRGVQMWTRWVSIDGALEVGEKFVLIRLDQADTEAKWLLGTLNTTGTASKEV